MGDCEESPGADQVTLREHLTDPEDFAAARGTTLLRFASPGPLIGHVAGWRCARCLCP